MQRYVAEGSVLDLAKDLGFTLYDKRFARVYEYQADEAGIKLMLKAGYNPQGAISVFNMLEANTVGSKLPEFLQDHPITKSRIQALVKKYNISLQ